MRSLNFPFLIILLANLLVFYPAINSHLFWDDSIFFKSSLLRDAEHPLVYWMSGPFGKSWPTAFSVLKLLHSIFGEQYWLYKLAGLLLHTVNAGLIFGALEKFLSRPRSLLITLLFALHPMQVESVLWIFQMNTLLATFFLLVSAHFFCAYRNGRLPWLWYALSLLAFLLSVTSKSLALFFPLLMLFYLWKMKKRWAHILLLTLPFFALSFHFGLNAYRGTSSYPNEISYQRNLLTDLPSSKKEVPEVVEAVSPEVPKVVETVSPEVPKVVETVSPEVLEVSEVSEVSEAALRKEEIPPPILAHHRPLHVWDKVQLFFEGLSFYAAKSIAPHPLLFMYPQRPFHWAHGVFLAGLVLLFIYLRKRRPAADYFFLCWLVAFIPTSGIAYIAHFKFSFVANRYMYLGLVGFMGLLVSLIPSSWKWKKLYAPLGVISLLYLAAIAHPYARAFTHPTAIYEHNYRHHPQNVYPLLLLARQYASTGQRKMAMATLDKVVANPHPFFFHAFFSTVQSIFDLEKERWVYLSKWYTGLGRPDEAQTQLKKALLVHPHDPEIKKLIEDFE